MPCEVLNSTTHFFNSKVSLNSSSVALQVTVALISFLETMLITYLSYKVKKEQFAASQRVLMPAPKFVKPFTVAIIKDLALRINDIISDSNLAMTS